VHGEALELVHGEALELVHGELRRIHAAYQHASQKKAWFRCSKHISN